MNNPDRPLYFQGKWWFISEDRSIFSTEDGGVYPIKFWIPRTNTFYNMMDFGYINYES